MRAVAATGRVRAAARMQKVAQKHQPLAPVAVAARPAGRCCRPWCPWARAGPHGESWRPCQSAHRPRTGCGPRGHRTARPGSGRSTVPQGRRQGARARWIGMRGRAGCGGGRCRGSHGAPSIPMAVAVRAGVARNGPGRRGQNPCRPGVGVWGVRGRGLRRIAVQVPVGGVARWCQVRAHGVVCGHFQRLHHAIQPVAQALGAEPLAESAPPSAAGQRAWGVPACARTVAGPSCVAGSGPGGPCPAPAPAARPGPGPAAGCPGRTARTRRSRGSDEACSCRLLRCSPGWLWKMSPGNPCNFAKAPARHFSGVQARQRLGFQSFPHGAVRRPRRSGAAAARASPPVSPTAAPARSH